MVKHSYLIYCTTMNVKVTRHYKANRFILYNSLLLSNCNAITIAIAIQTEHLDIIHTLFYLLHL